MPGFPRNEVIQGDCVEEMQNLPENSVDAVVTDPPYNFDKGFMGKDWDNIGSPKQYQEWCMEWGQEALRVLKPGAYLVAFSGTKMYHRLVTGLEDAGFRIVDQISWMYGSGFPKSHDFTKDLSDEEASEWQGCGTAIKPSHEPIVVAQKPREGTYADNVEKHGVGGFNIDGCRIGLDRDEEISVGYKTLGDTHEGWKRDWMDDEERWEEYKKEAVDKANNDGRWPANSVLTHSPACRRVGTAKVEGDSREGGDGERPGGFVDTGADKGDGEPNSVLYGDEDGTEEVEKWRCVPSCPVRLLNMQSGDRPAGGGIKDAASNKTDRTYGEFKERRNWESYGDSGGAARFFYSAKAHKSERNAGLEGEGVENDIATLKPINLLRWLVRLVTPPMDDVVVLDPFAGSGTTGCAAEIEDVDYILIEKRERFAETVAPKRIQYWSNPENWGDLKSHAELPDKEPEKEVNMSLSRFGEN